MRRQVRLPTGMGAYVGLPKAVNAEELPNVMCLNRLHTMFLLITV